jgi:regulatory protein
VTNDYQILLAQTLRFLGIRPRSSQEILRYLHSKTRDSVLIDRLAGKLTQSKLIDDAEFTRWYVESRSRSRPRGARLLVQELKSKGITYDPQLTTDNQVELATAALAQKQKSWSQLTPKDRRPKAIRFLQSRGFSWGTIERTLKKEYN